MRDPKRIEETLILFKKVWDKNPDLRFFQLVELLRNRMGKEDLFYLEDTEFQKFLRTFQFK